MALSPGTAAAAGAAVAGAAGAFAAGAVGGSADDPQAMANIRINTRERGRIARGFLNL
jgi:hypothetical protein